MITKVFAAGRRHQPDPKPAVKQIIQYNGSDNSVLQLSMDMRKPARGRPMKKGDRWKKS